MLKNRIHFSYGNFSGYMKRMQGRVGCHVIRKVIVRTFAAVLLGLNFSHSEL